MVEDPDILGAFLLSAAGAIFLGWLSFAPTRFRNFRSGASRPKNRQPDEWTMRLFYIFLGMTIALGVVLFSDPGLQASTSENFCGLGSRIACYQDDGSAVTW